MVLLFKTLSELNKNEITAAGGIMTRSYIINCLTATPFIRGNPTGNHVNGNVGVLSSQDSRKSGSSEEEG